MKRFYLSCLICCMALCVFAQKPNNTGRYTVIVQEGYPISLSQYTYMITPDCDLYYIRGVFFLLKYTIPEIVKTLDASCGDALGAYGLPVA